MPESFCECEQRIAISAESDGGANGEGSKIGVADMQRVDVAARRNLSVNSRPLKYEKTRRVDIDGKTRADVPLAEPIVSRTP